MRTSTTLLVAAAALLTLSLQAERPRKRALLVGINDYTASKMAGRQTVPPNRDWANLGGTINDIEWMRGMLVSLYGFAPGDVTTLRDQQATRKAITDGLGRLAATAKKDDVVLFYYSGHGSQVRNTKSSEQDKLDESLVPADSRRGEPDIRDKELRDLFNRILDRGARLTVVIDACHSGSGARGLDGGLPVRQIATDDRDVADPSTGPKPEDRGALILSASQDFDEAFETRDEHGTIRGAFSWAFFRALRDAEPGETVNDTFLRTHARLRAERPGQDPVLAGTEPARLRPFLGERTDRRDLRTNRPIIAIDGIDANARYLLQGGWAHGLTIGTELRLRGNDGVRLEVQALDGVARSRARLVPNRERAATPRLGAGTLLEIARWAPPLGAPLRVWIPRAGETTIAFARQLREAAAKRSIRWIDDPTVTTPTHLIRWRDREWELVAGGRAKRTATPLEDVPAGAHLFVQVPAPPRLADAILASTGVEQVAGPESADYILAGRVTAKRIEYALIRPRAAAADTTSPLPSRTKWSGENTAFALQDALIRLQRVYGWLDLDSPPGAVAHYQLALRRTDDNVLVTDGVLEGGRPHHLELRAKRNGPVYTRYLYAFVIDSAGSSVLLFPRLVRGSVENRLPVTSQATKPVAKPPAEIALNASEPFTIAPPYGTDTYFLLSTEEPLAALSALEWAGVRGEASSEPKNALERLLALKLTGDRGNAEEDIRTPPNWTIQKVSFHSVPPRRNKP